MRRLIAIAAAFLFASLSIAQAQSDALIDELVACRAIEKNKKRLACLDAAIAGLAAPGRQAAAATDAPAATPIAGDDATGEGAPAASPVVSAPPQPPASVAAPAVVAASPEEEFGADDLKAKRAKKEKDDRPKTLSARAVDVATNKRGKLIIILDNGQIWRQINADTNKLRVPKNPEGEAMVVRRKSLGGYTLGFENDRRRIKVERIK